jgi:WhiB family redox-sensing transcriptional regulator
MTRQEILETRWPTDHNPTWKQDAACRNINPETFFPEKENKNINIIGEYCNNCLVKKPCLNYALQHHEKGIWGGTTTKQRQRIQRTKKQRGGDDTTP